MKLSPSSRFDQFEEYNKAIGILTLNCTLRPHLESKDFASPFLPFPPWDSWWYFLFLSLYKRALFLPLSTMPYHQHDCFYQDHILLNPPWAFLLYVLEQTEFVSPNLRFQSSTGHILGHGASLMEMVPLDFSFMLSPLGNQTQSQVQKIAGHLLHFPPPQLFFRATLHTKNQSNTQPLLTIWDSSKGLLANGDMCVGTELEEVGSP